MRCISAQVADTFAARTALQMLHTQQTPGPHLELVQGIQVLDGLGCSQQAHQAVQGPPQHGLRPHVGRVWRGCEAEVALLQLLAGAPDDKVVPPLVLCCTSLHDRGNLGPPALTHLQQRSMSRPILLLVHDVCHSLPLRKGPNNSACQQSWDTALPL